MIAYRCLVRFLICVRNSENSLNAAHMIWLLKDAHCTHVPDLRLGEGRMDIACTTVLSPMDGRLTGTDSLDFEGCPLGKCSAVCEGLLVGLSSQADTGRKEVDGRCSLEFIDRLMRTSSLLFVYLLVDDRLLSMWSPSIDGRTLERLAAPFLGEFWLFIWVFLVVSDCCCLCWVECTAAAFRTVNSGESWDICSGSGTLCDMDVFFILTLTFRRGCAHGVTVLISIEGIFSLTIAEIRNTSKQNFKMMKKLLNVFATKVFQIWIFLPLHELSVIYLR